MDKWIVYDARDDLNLIKFLKSKYEQYSLRQIKRLLEDNVCTINGMTERFASVPVFRGDVITFKVVEKQAAKNESTLLKSRVLYEDEDLLAYNKPAGIASESFKTQFLLIHRLDKDTTGVLMFAKSERFLKKMIALFRKQHVHKVYFALVDGCPKTEHGRMDNYLGKKHVYAGQTIWGSVPQERGLHAVTNWKLEKRGKKCSLLKCFPITGRTHQIRVHLSESNLPILGDYHYCKRFTSTYQPRRCLLHASKVIFIHPTTFAKIEIEAPIPADFLIAFQEM